MYYILIPLIFIVQLQYVRMDVNQFNHGNNKNIEFLKKCTRTCNYEGLCKDHSICYCYRQYYIGRNCTILANNCASRSRLPKCNQSNTHQCQPYFGGRMCFCNPGYSGELCQYHIRGKTIQTFNFLQNCYFKKMLKF